MKTHTIQREALMEAIRIAGSQRRLAFRLRDIGHVAPQQCISHWLVHGMPAHHAPYIEAVTGVSRWRLLPDAFYQFPTELSHAPAVTPPPLVGGDNHETPVPARPRRPLRP